MRDFIILLLLLCVSAPGSAMAQEPENLARGKRYTWDPRPTYPLCRDSQDKVQLTDGVFS